MRQKAFLLCFFLITFTIATGAQWADEDGAVIPASIPGAPWAWGSNYYGQLGDGTNTDRLTPAAVSLQAGTTITDIAAGAVHTVALTSTGGVLSWGANYVGQLGNGTNVSSNTPVTVSLPAGTTVTAIAAGSSHSLALTSSGSVLAWGDNFYGQLGDGTAGTRNAPVAVLLPAGTTVTAIAAGKNHSLALTSTGAVLAWGQNSLGQLGDGTNQDRRTPVAVSLPPGAIITAISGGGVHSLAITSSGGALAWGDNYYGELGDGTNTTSLTPVSVLLPAGTTATAVAAGLWHSLALTSTGSVLGWGFNGFGQLGNPAAGGGTNRPVTASLPACTAATAIAAGTRHTLAITAIGTVLAWGYNNEGELGNGTIIQSTLPVAVSTPAGAMGARISGGEWHSASLLVPCPVITLGTLADGAAGVPYDGSAAASPAQNYLYELTCGSLPPGVSLDPSSGSVTGTPADTGTFTFSITATDPDGCKGSRSYTIAISCPSITLLPETLPNGALGYYYSQSLFAEPPGGDYTFSLTGPGILPPGLSLSAEGTISGMPTNICSVAFTVTATGWGECSTSRDYRIDIVCPTITLSPASLPGGILGSFYSQAFSADPPGTTYRWLLSDGALPPGITLDYMTGTLSGVPDTLGIYTFTVMARGWGACTGIRAYTLNISCPTITLSPPSPLPNASLGAPYSQSITASPAGTIYTYSVSVGPLPPGMTLSPAGLLSGTPTAAGSYSFTIAATGWASCSGSQTYSLAVCTPIAINPTTIKNGSPGTPYSQVLKATGSATPCTFSVTSGSLPPGLTIASGGLISGTPTAEGVFNFTVTATNAIGCTGARSYTLSISSYDANLLDDAGLSKMCFSTVTGKYIWTILSGPGAGTYSGVGRVTWDGGVARLEHLNSSTGYHVLGAWASSFNAGKGLFEDPSRGIKSTLADSNTANNPPGC